MSAVLRPATLVERSQREWFLVDPARPLDACALASDGQWVDPSNAYPRLFTDAELVAHKIAPGLVWQEHDA